MSLVPQFLELVHRGEAQAFPHRAARGGGVADVADHDSRTVVDLLEEGRAHGDVARTAHNGVVGIDAERGEEGVHRAAHTLIEPGITAEDFGQRTIEEEVNGQLLHTAGEALLHHAQALPTKEILHDAHQRVVIQLVDRREALGEDFAVTAMTAVDVVFDIQQIGLADGGGFLADGQMGRTAVVVGDALVGALELHFVQHVLEAADDHHVALDALEVVFAEVLQLILDRLVVLVHRDRLEFHKPRPAHIRRHNHLRFRHVLFSFLF